MGLTGGYAISLFLTVKPPRQADNGLPGWQGIRILWTQSTQNPLKNALDPEMDPVSFWIFPARNQWILNPFATYGSRSFFAARCPSPFSAGSPGFLARDGYPGQPRAIVSARGHIGFATQETHFRFAGAR